MRIERKQDLSIYYWLEDQTPSTVNVKDGFPGSDLTLPTVSITNLEIEGRPFELGGAEKDYRFWRIDIFADNKVQRDRLAYDLYEQLECHIPVYDYDEGFPPSVDPTQIGTLMVKNRLLTPVRVFEELVEKLYWRTEITFSTYYEIYN